MAFSIAAALAALGKGFEAYEKHQDARTEASSLRRKSRGVMLDAASEADRLRAEGRDFIARQSQAFLKSGVSLQGSPLLAIQESERRIKAEIDAMNRRAEGEAYALRKGRKAAQRRGRMAILGGGINVGSSVYGAK